MEFGFWSVVPPVVTIALALIIKNVFVALFVGITLASLILSGWNVFTGVNGAFYSIVHTFESSGNTIVIMSMFLIGALIYLIEHSGGIDGFVDIMVKKKGIIKTKNPRPSSRGCSASSSSPPARSAAWSRAPSRARSTTR